MPRINCCAYMSLEDQQKTIRKSIDLLETCGGKKVTGWAARWSRSRRRPRASGAGRPEMDLRRDLCRPADPDQTPHGIIAGVPTTDFSDNRVMRASPRDLYDAYKGTFDYLPPNEPMSLLVLVIHCQFGGRPLMTAVLQDILQYIAKSPDVWFARHEELANWALAGGVESTPIEAAISMVRG